MADKEIDDLTAAGDLTGVELVHVIQTDYSRKVAVSEIAEIGSPIITEATAGRTLVATDAGKWIRCTSASAVTIGIPDAVFTAGDEICFEQANAQITYAPAVGVTMVSAADADKSNGIGTVQALKFITASTVILFGGLEAPA